MAFHSLRLNSFAKRMKCYWGTVQELFAHSFLVTTQRYVHTNSKRKREAIDILNSYT